MGTSSAPQYVFVLNRGESRLSFGYSNRRIEFARGRNRVSAVVWSVLETGAARLYIAKRILVVVSEPDEDLEVSVAEPRGTGTPAPVANPAVKRSPEDEKLIQALMAELEARRAGALSSGDPLVAPAPPFDPGTVSITKLDEQLSTSSFSVGELRELRAAEEGGKSRQGALEVIGAALELAEEG